jgi:hypothetical protein
MLGSAVAINRRAINRGLHRLVAKQTAIPCAGNCLDQDEHCTDPAPVPHQTCVSVLMCCPTPADGATNIENQVFSAGRLRSGICTTEDKKRGMCRHASECIEADGCHTFPGFCRRNSICNVMDDESIVGELGIDVSTTPNSKSFDCFKRHKVTFASVRCFTMGGRADSACVPSVRAFRAAGFRDVSLYFFLVP